MSLPLIHSPGDILRRVLIAMNLGTEQKLKQPWPVFHGSEPTMPDNCITTYDTTNVSDGRSMIDGETWYHYGCQIRIRAVDHPTGFAKAEQIRRALDESLLEMVITIPNPPGQPSVDSTYQVNSAHKTAVVALGKNVPTSKRSLYTINPTLPILRVA